MVTCRKKPKPLPRRQILDSSKLKEFADENFKFDANGRKSIQMGRKHCGESRNCLLQAISPFFTVLPKKTCTADTLKPGLVWERVNSLPHNADF